MHQLCVCHFVVFLLLISLLTVNKQHLVSLSLSWLVGSILIFFGGLEDDFFFWNWKTLVSCSCRTRHGHSSKVRLETYEASLQFTAASEWRLCHPGLSSHLEPEFLLLARKTTENVWKPLNTLVCCSGNGQQNDSLHSGTRIWKIFAIYGCWIPKTLCQVWSLWTFSIIESIVHGEWLKQMS